MQRVIKAVLKSAAYWRVPLITPEIVATFDHDETAFTQGLACHGDYLYESCGGESNSRLRRLRQCDGSEDLSVAITGDFAEGIGILDDQLFQLSWKSGVAREFSLPDLTCVRTHSYSGEGWGLTSDGHRLVRTDGSSNLTVSDAQFHPFRCIRVSSNGLPIRWLNDLAFRGDRVYVNVVADNVLVEACYATGRVLRAINCRQLSDLTAPHHEYSIFNGIAYCAREDLFYVTGKRWRKLFLIRIPQ